MRVRALPGLASSSDEVLFSQLATGMDLIADHVGELTAGIEILRQSESARAANALAVHRDDVAAVYLILLDVVRSGGDQASKAHQLRRSYKHLVRSIYVLCAGMRPQDFKEVRLHVEGMRRSHYLDGPNGDDWVFRGEAHADREDNLYVDLVEADGERHWWTPGNRDAFGVWSAENTASMLVKAMRDVGLHTRDGLQAVAEIWRGQSYTDSTHFMEIQPLVVRTLEAVVAAGRGPMADPKAACRVILDGWHFPLHGLDMEAIAVDPDRLRTESG